MLGFVLLVLWRARPAFDRRAAFFDTRFTAPWSLAVAGARSAPPSGSASSHSSTWPIRASCGGSSSCTARRRDSFVRPSDRRWPCCCSRSRASSRPHATRPTTRRTPIIEAAGAIVASQTSASAYLVYLRDKALLFDEQRRGFVMTASREGPGSRSAIPSARPTRIRT